MAIANQEMIRDNNRRQVLEYLVNHPPISRAALSKELHLTKATISNIVQELIEQNLITEIGSAQTAMGRRPILLEFSKKCGFAFSIDVHPHQIITLLTDLRGEDCRLREYPFHEEDDLFSLLCSIIEKTLPECSHVPYGIVGITVGIYGVVQENRIAFTPYYPLPRPDLCTLLEDKFGIPVTVENESNLSVLGESAFHYNYKNMVHLNIHDGVGMGILIGEKLYKGKDGYAGEFGHTILFPDGRPCPCGNQGCFEQYASEKAILEEYASRIRSRTPVNAVETASAAASDASSFTGGPGIPAVTIDEFLRAYQAMEPEALEMMDLFVKYMSIGINNIINTFNIDLVILNSAFSTYIPDIITRIREYLEAHQNRDCRILPSRLQDISGLMGGIRLGVEHFLDIRHLKIQVPEIEPFR